MVNCLVGFLDMDSLLSTDRMLDRLFDEIDTLLIDGKFDEVDDFIKSIEIPAMSIEYLLGVLTITLQAQDKLKSRSTFFALVEIYFDGKEIKDRKKLLMGLE